MDLRPALGLLAAATLSGCLAGGGPCAAVEAEALTPWVGRDYLATDPEARWDTLLLVPEAASADRVEVGVGASRGWTAHATPVGPAGSALHQVSAQPDGAGAGRVEAAWSLDRTGGGCHAGDSGTMAWLLDPPTPGEAAQPGQGVHVHTAGFWENGTLFYTNIEALHENPSWPRAGWYAWEGGDALAVYVYDAERGERPPLWAPAAGSPADGVVPLWSYSTTIPGFNEALKGLSTHTTRVARLEPEEAYTRPGNEDHPLYGDALVFYIKVDKVVDLPCPEPSLTTCRLPGAARGAEGPSW